jgi:hypothetical protein
VAAPEGVDMRLLVVSEGCPVMTHRDICCDA